MSTACGRPQGGGGSGSCGRMWTGEGGQKSDFCGRHKWTAPYFMLKSGFMQITQKHIINPLPTRQCFTGCCENRSHPEQVAKTRFTRLVTTGSHQQCSTWMTWLFNSLSTIFTSKLVSLVFC